MLFLNTHIAEWKKMKIRKSSLKSSLCYWNRSFGISSGWIQGKIKTTNTLLQSFLSKNKYFANKYKIEKKVVYFLFYFEHIASVKIYPGVKLMFLKWKQNKNPEKEWRSNFIFQIVWKSISHCSAWEVELFPR